MKDSLRTCHKHPSLVLTSKGLEIYADSMQGVEEVFREFDLVISLGQEIRFKVSSTYLLESKPFRRLLGLKKNSNMPEILYLNWPDMSVPSYSREFWVELSRILKKKGNDRDRRGRKYKVIMHCYGGHGRTGTALAILSRFIEGRINRLVMRIREGYCPNAVETSGQISYVERITGILEGAIVSRSKDYSSQYKPTNHSSASSGVAESSSQIQTLFDKDEKEDSKSNIDDYFKNRNKWRKDYTN